jgi:hypothetical protein
MRSWWYCPGVPVKVSGKAGVIVEDPTNDPEKVLIAYTDGSTKVGYRKVKITGS